ncbi:DUF5668 domain-containing protein [Mucilaginibacter sp. PAMB04274]|uniref:LiaI-LiaF-like domain-containing protein n=1 Tax=Mucilaginibacter sp. PAMB04274 TaxID=3138568 RepID=UPI0031F62E47
MKNDRLFSGLVLVIIGAAFLLHNFGVVDFHWYNIVRLWPIFLVIGGINLLLANTRTVWATIVKVGVLVIGLGFVLFSNAGRRHNDSSLFNFHYNVDDDDDNDVDLDIDDDKDDDIKALKANATNVFQQPYTADIKHARLNVSGGATSYVLNTSTDSLFKAATREYYGNYNLSTSKEDSVTVVDFDMDKHNQHFRLNGGHMNVAQISLNTAPIWDLNLRGGAAKVDFDLTPYKVRSLNISGGAASCDIKMAANLPLTDVTVSTGASEVTIRIPKNAACDIAVSSGLSSNDFDGFTKISSSHYTTPGFEAAKNKIYLKLKGGVSDFNVRRY